MTSVREPRCIKEGRQVRLLRPEPKLLIPKTCLPWSRTSVMFLLLRSSSSEAGTVQLRLMETLSLCGQLSTAERLYSRCSDRVSRVQVAESWTAKSALQLHCSDDTTTVQSWESCDSLWWHDAVTLNKCHQQKWLCVMSSECEEE